MRNGFLGKEPRATARGLGGKGLNIAIIPLKPSITVMGELFGMALLGDMSTM